MCCCCPCCAACCCVCAVPLLFSPPVVLLCAHVLQVGTKRVPSVDPFEAVDLLVREYMVPLAQALPDQHKQASHTPLCVCQS